MSVKILMKKTLMKKILMKKVLMKKIKYRTLTLQRVVEYNAKITAELLNKISSDS